MKKLLGIVVLGLLLNSNTFADMSHSTDKDEFKGKTYHYIMTDLVKPNKPLSFPYDNTQSSLVVGCVENDYYYAYVYFTSANLTGSPYPKSKADINKKIIHGVDYFVETIDNDNLRPSKIIRIIDEKNYTVIRD